MGRLVGGPMTAGPQNFAMTKTLHRQDTRVKFGSSSSRILVNGGRHARYIIIRDPYGRLRMYFVHGSWTSACTKPERVAGHRHLLFPLSQRPHAIAVRNPARPVRRSADLREPRSLVASLPPASGGRDAAGRCAPA